MKVKELVFLPEESVLLLEPSDLHSLVVRKNGYKHGNYAAYRYHQPEDAEYPSSFFHVRALYRKSGQKYQIHDIVSISILVRSYLNLSEPTERSPILTKEPTI